MKKPNTASSKTTQPPTWLVKGPNWTWKKKASPRACPMELATQALEDIWSKDPKMQSKIQQLWLKKEHSQPTLGLSLCVYHTKMKSKENRVLICSVTALANAGHHKESNELRQLTLEA